MTLATPTLWRHTLRPALTALAAAATLVAVLVGTRPLAPGKATRLDPADPGEVAAAAKGPLAFAQPFWQWSWAQERLAASSGARFYLARYGRPPKDYETAAVAVAGPGWASHEGWWGLPSEPQGGQPLPVDLPAD